MNSKIDYSELQYNKTESIIASISTIKGLNVKIVSVTEIYNYVIENYIQVLNSGISVLITNDIRLAIDKYNELVGEK